MKRFIRIVGISLGLLLLFLVAVVFTNGWLQRQNEQLLADTIRARTTQFTQILALTKADPPPWTEDFTRSLGHALDARLIVLETPPPTAPTPGISSERWRFDHVFRNAEGAPTAYVRVQLQPPPTVRVMVMLNRVSALLLSLALLLLVVLILLVLVDSRWLQTDETSELARDTAPRDEVTILSRLAERSVRQSAELEKEREDRQRAEADAHLKQILLNQALQEKIDMGRDLHDGLIQSLYATGLTIQAGRKALDHDHAEARTQIDTALQTLNSAIREVRAYISGLGPEHLRQRSFGDSVRAVVEHHCAVRELAVDVRIDEETANHLAPAQVTDLLQIVREAVSNSVRHGHARQLSVVLHRNGDELCLLIQDNGRGFDLPSAIRGHGLDNMQARAERLGAKLQCHTAPGQGTRLVLTFTAPASPHRS
ncbi:MAG TPA: sensor histidine kinase [Opitutaceae bacterium]|nr:sensor histidine kinase [Opitutaceae bacterium]